MRVQLTHAAEEFGRVGLQLDGARGECVATLPYRGQDRAGTAVDLLSLHLGALYLYRYPDPISRPQITFTGTIIEYFIKVSSQGRQAIAMVIGHRVLWLYRSSHRRQERAVLSSDAQHFSRSPSQHRL